MILKNKAPLAIVIPAYKPDFLREAIESVLNQTNQNFTLYIFDDASPYKLNLTLSEYSSVSNIVYHQFEQNLGQTSLTKQWDRCINNTGSEPWVWLFSDDDLMDVHCVQSFYDELGRYPDADLFRFKSNKISSEGKVLRVNEFSNPLTAEEFIQKKLSYEQESYMVESIFKRSLYEKIGGFPELPLAWAADDLFHFRLYSFGIGYFIDKASVSWRYSSENLSGKKSRSAALSKLEASRIFVREIRREISGSLSIYPENLPELWYIRQIKTLHHQLNLFDELKSVFYLNGGFRSWIAYVAMKWRNSKIHGCLKKF